MNAAPNPADFLRSSVAIIAGTQARILDVTATSEPQRIPRLDPSDWLARVERPPFDAVLNAFVAAVGLGLFSYQPTPAPQAAKVTGHKLGAVMIDMWEVAIPAVSEGAFDVLLRMAETSAALSGGLIELSVIERASVNLSRVGRAQLVLVGVGAPPFRVDNHVGSGERKEVPIVVTFVDDVAPSTFDYARVLFETWGRVLRWGGFAPARGWPSSTGAVTAVGRHLTNEFVATVEGFASSGAAWDVLCRGLHAVHAVTPIERLEIG